MKKKIFIAGAVREYDSNAPEDFGKAIEDYIRENLVTQESNISVKAKDNGINEITIEIPFTTGDELSTGTISNPLYRCFFGECESFRPEYSLDFRLNFGPNWGANWRVVIEDIVDAHKKNSNFYHASRYKDLFLEETETGLIIKLTY